MPAEPAMSLAGVVLSISLTDLPPPPLFSSLSSPLLPLSSVPPDALKGFHNIVILRVSWTLDR